MDPTTIRLPPDTLDELDSEYIDYGYGARSDYIRDIIEHRDPPFTDSATTAATTTDYDRPTTDDYERLRDRVDELEGRVEELELNQQTGQDADIALVNDGMEDIELPADPSPDAEPQGSDGQDVVEYVRDNQPVSRSDIIDAFANQWGEKGSRATPGGGVEHATDSKTPGSSTSGMLVGR